MRQYFLVRYHTAGGICVAHISQFGSSEISYSLNIKKQLLPFASLETDTMASQRSTEEPTAKATTSFVTKLYDIVNSGDKAVVDWHSNGESFIIYDADVFSKVALAPNFKSSLFSSFVRQLHLCKSGSNC